MCFCPECSESRTNIHPPVTDDIVNRTNDSKVAQTSSQRKIVISEPRLIEDGVIRFNVYIHVYISYFLFICVFIISF